MTYLMPNPMWSHPPEAPDLGAADLHVWRAPLIISADCYARYYHVCSPDERERAARFRFRQDTVAFIAARGALRETLSRYVGIAATELCFECDAFGKPRLRSHDAPSPIHFNLSHSGSWALIAITRATPVGIDVEYLKPDIVCDDIAEQFFSPSEVRAFKHAPVGARTLAFFSCWTRKEAFVKAKGQGLSFDLKQFDVSILPDDYPRLLRTEYDYRDRRRWAIHAFRVDHSHIGAIAADSGLIFMKYFELSTGEIHGREQRRRSHLQGSCESRRAVLDLARG